VSSPKPSALPEWESLGVPGTVPAPFSNSVVFVAIIHEKALSFCEFNDVSLTTQIGPWALVMWFARAVIGRFDASSILLHNSRAYFGRLDLIFPRIVHGAVGNGRLVWLGIGSGLMSILNPVHCGSHVSG